MLLIRDFLSSALLNGWGLEPRTTWILTEERPLVIKGGHHAVHTRATRTAIVEHVMTGGTYSHHVTVAVP